MSSFCLHAIIIHSRPHTRLHLSHIMASERTDLNPVDYKVWSVVKEQVYHTPTLNDLKQRLLDVWAAVDKRIIYYFINVHFCGRRSSNAHIFLSIESNVMVCWNHILE